MAVHFSTDMFLRRRSTHRIGDRIDVHGPQLREAQAWCESAGLTNTSFVRADACDTGVPRGSFDLVYCRYLLLHLADPMRRLRDLYHMVIQAGFVGVDIELHQPAITRGENRAILKWSVEEAGPSFVEAGVTSASRLDQTLADMQDAADDPEVLILAPQTSVVWGYKPTR